MFYVVDTQKSFEEASQDLEIESKKLGFGVLHVHNMGETLRSKGIDFSGNCKIFEVCSPVHANKIITIDMKLNMALPCKISVYTEDGSTKIGMIKPSDMFSTLSNSADLLEISQDIENKTIEIINNTK